MDWLTSVTEIVKSFAWPVAAVVIIWMVREPLGRLLPLLEELEWKGLKAKFRKGVKEAEKVAAESLPPEIPVTPQDRLHSELNAEEEISGRFGKLLEISPEAAVLDAWRMLEEEMRAAAVRLQLSYPVHSSLFGISEKFGHDGWITPEQTRLIVALRKLRNLAAHGGQDRAISVADASRALRMIEALARYFRSLTPDSPKVPKRGPASGDGTESR
ncbi:MAG: hypothetical protein ABSH08_04325 [Tepidisphaeraceae bacterium]|jgi:hypothetical protein